MINKKANAGVTIAIVVIILIIIAVGITIFIIFQKGYFVPKTPETNETQIKMYLTTKDISSGESVKANYVIYNGETELNKGEIQKNETREIDVDGSQLTSVYCWSDDYYLVRAIKTYSPVDLEVGKATFSCDMSKIEKNLKVEHIGTLDNINSIITLNLTARDKFQRLSICTSWTSGFVNAILQNDLISCNFGLWKNYTDYNETKKDFNYLPEGEWICGKDQIERCEVAIGNKCKPPTEKEPLRFQRKTDTCSYLGESIESNSKELTFHIKKSLFTSRNDYVEFRIYDYDRRFVPETGKWEWGSEFNAEDVASKDVIYKIYWEGNDG